MAALAGVALVGQAHASTMPITFSGQGVSGSLEITFGPGTDAKYSNAFEITGVSGTFSDTNNGLDIVNASVSLFPILSPPSAPEFDKSPCAARFQQIRGRVGLARPEQRLRYL